MDGITGSSTLGGVVLAACAAAGFAIFKVRSYEPHWRSVGQKGKIELCETLRDIHIKERIKKFGHFGKFMTC